MDKKTKNGIITVGVIAALGLVGYKLLKKPKGIPEPNRGGGVDPNSGGGITNPPPPSPSTDADFNALVAAYATRTVSSGFGNIFASNFSGGLIATLKQECSSGERQAINQILADKGITKRI